MARKKKLTSGKAETAHSAQQSTGDQARTSGANDEILTSPAPLSSPVAGKKKPASSPKQPQNSAQGVRRSTLYFAVGIALMLGLYLGTLLPSLMRDPAATAQVGQAGPQGQAAEAVPPVSPDITKHILELEQLVAKNPQDLAAWVNLGNLYFDTHNHKGAIVAYEKALAIKPDNADVLTDLGIMYRDEKMYPQAVDAFTRATQVNPKHQNALFNRGVVLFYDMNRQEEGRAIWRQLLAVNPKAKAPDGKSVRDMVDGR